MTARDFYATLKSYAVEKNDIEAAEFCDKQVDAIDRKNVKARERAEKQRTADQIMEAVAKLLTDEFQTAEDILNQIELADVTKAKVSNRLSRLAAAGHAVKDTVKVEKRQLVAYKRA